MSEPQDRLYELLPAIYRLRDAERNYPLRDLLRVVAEQVTAVEDDITRLYDDWFIETASDWAVPYIANLVGYEPVLAAGDPAASGAAENRILMPRRDVANTIAFRRRRGTLPVLELLAAAVAGWPARAVEFYRLLGWTQPLNFQQSEGARARLATLRDANDLERIGTAFDPFARTVDIRRLSSPRSQGRYNIPGVGLFVWRLRSYPVTRTPAFCVDAGKHQYTFSVLGNDAPLFARALPESSPSTIAGELNVPAPIRRRALASETAAYVPRSLAVWTDWGGHDPRAPLPASVIIAADLSHWHYVPPPGFIAIDPVRGRLAFPRTQAPERYVRVSYCYGFSADIGGGEYDRPLSAPRAHRRYTVGEHGQYKRIGQALAAWREAKPRHAVIEITDSNVYVEQVGIELGDNQSLQLRAANRVRPVIRLLDWQTDMPDALTVKMAARSRFVLDGLLITGRGLDISGVPPQESPAYTTKTPAAQTTHTEHPRNPACPSEVLIRHCTLVPGWAIDTQCRPHSPNKESLALNNLRAAVRVEHSILGPIEVVEDEVRMDPIPLSITDSIVDAMEGDREAISGDSARHAHVGLTVRRSTIFGIVQVHAIDLAENSIFLDCLHVARRQVGCVRFCYVPPGCRTPRRFSCQPDMVMEAARGRLAGAPAAARAAAEARHADRVRPRFTARHYGAPAYAQLSAHAAVEIASGAEDGAEMGAFHDLFQPQRLANLRGRLASFVPSGNDPGVILAS